MGFFRSKPTLVIDQHRGDEPKAIEAGLRGDFKTLDDYLNFLMSEGLLNARSLILGEVAEGLIGYSTPIREWQELQPLNPNPANILSTVLIAEAWEVRTGRSASEVSREQFRTFFEMLNDAKEQIIGTAMKFPLDPSSWGNVINWGKGSQLPMEEWQEILKLAKESMGDGFYWRRGLCDAWSSWWGGSFDLSWNFALASMSEHPESANRLLPLTVACREAWRENTVQTRRAINDSIPFALHYLEGPISERDKVFFSNVCLDFLYVAKSEAGDEIGRDHFYPFLRIADKRVDTAAWTWVESPKSAVEKMSTLVKQYG